MKIVGTILLSLSLLGMNAYASTSEDEAIEQAIKYSTSPHAVFGHSLFHAKRGNKAGFKSGIMEEYLSIGGRNIQRTFEKSKLFLGEELSAKPTSDSLKELSRMFMLNENVVLSELGLKGNEYLVKHRPIEISRSGEMDIFGDIGFICKTKFRDENNKELYSSCLLAWLP